jgi:hypothetical protein
MFKMKKLVPKYKIRNRLSLILPITTLKNGIKYQVTFLEFGAKGCSACKRMESVMSKIRTKYSNRVNVVFVASLS